MSGKEVIKALSKVGFVHVRTKGSHAILTKQMEKGHITIPVPLHPELAKGTLKSIMDQAGLTRDEFLKLI